MIGLSRTGTHGPVRRIVVVVAALLFVFVGSTATAYALWRTTASAGFSAGAATVPVPVNFKCVVGAKSRDRFIDLTWQAPTATPAPTGYELVRGGQVLYTGVNTSWSMDDTNGPLTGQYTVRSLLQPTAWRSSSSTVITVTLQGNGKPAC